MPNLPEIDFLTTDATALTNDLVKLYEDLAERKLSQADPLHLIFLSFASVLSKQNVIINDAAKQNLLFYSRNDVLDHKGAEWSTERLEATCAKTTLRVHLSVPLETSRIIGKGSLATSNEGAIFFATTGEKVIEVGVNHVDVELECTTVGIVGNNFMPGQINTLVKPLPYVSHVENITTSKGGAPRESDESYKERIRLAPEAITNAGSEGAYAYFAKSTLALISDVYVHMPSPGRVTISVLLQNGELPTEEIINLVYENCSPKTVRPLTDHLTVTAPEVDYFDLEVEYFIDTNAIDKTIIHEKILKAIDDYVIWQQSKLARDINPSKLTADCMAAGAKRIVTNLTHTVIPKGHVAQLQSKTVTFGGLEDD